MAKNRLDFQAQLSRHDHDLSAGYTSTLAPGFIVPQFFAFMNPGDSLYLTSLMRARLQDLVTAFFGEIDIHIDYFFIPLQMLYTPFGQIYAQTDDFITSAYSATAQRDQYPVLNVGGVLTNTTFMVNANLGAGEVQGKNIARLLDALDCNPLGVCNSQARANVSYTGSHVADNNTVIGQVSPWLFAAYQCIYQKYFRNDEFERLDVKSYNFDFAWSSNQINGSDALPYLRCRRCQRPADYFTSARVSPIASAVNALYQNSASDGGFSANISYLDKVNTFLGATVTTYGRQDVDNLAATFSNTQFANGSTFVDYSSNGDVVLTAQNIRALFAVDKFVRIWGRADKTYDDQILAHFGIKIPHDVKHDITHVKGFRTSLMSDPIYGTANTQTLTTQGDQLLGTIGQVGAQGYTEFSSGEEKEKFTAPVHGIFMVTAYAVTKPRYISTFSKLHTLDNRLKFPIAEFDKLGAQPLYVFESDPAGLGAKQYFDGWQNRYQEFKRKYNRASITYNGSKYNYPVTNNNNIYASWVITRPAYNQPIGTVPTSNTFVAADYFYEDPHALDKVLVRQFTGTWSNTYFQYPHEMFQSDPIITDFFADATLVSWMSKSGEPDL